jgi:hypothetical protein
LTSHQLKRAAAIQEQIESLHQELADLLEGSAPAPAPAAPEAADLEAAAPKARRRKISAAGLARIKAAQKLRWAKVKAGTPEEPVARKTKRRMSPAARARIGAAAKARWAAIKAAGKKRL